MASTENLLSAVQLATKTLASTAHIDLLLPNVLQICMDAVGAEGGTVYLHDPNQRTLVFRHVLPEPVKGVLELSNIPDDFGMAGKAFQSGETVISEFEPAPDEARNTIESQTGIVVRTMITTPLTLEGDQPIGVVQLINKKDGHFTKSDAVVMDTVAAVSTLAYLNHKLAEDMTRASTLLGMGKVSHDIGNLASSLYANVNLAEFALGTVESAPDGGQNSMNVLKETVVDLRQSVERIVSYSRLISDLSAGRSVRPEKVLGSLAPTVCESASYLESQARDEGAEIRYDIQENAPEFEFDPQFIFRLVQNLVGNALKAVQESPKSEKLVTVRYRFTDDRHLIEIEDTGAGMKREIADRILAGNARSSWDKSGGSGWGTKIVLELAASHDGFVEIDSELGKGSIFRVVFPNLAKN